MIEKMADQLITTSTRRSFRVHRSQEFSYLSSSARYIMTVSNCSCYLTVPLKNKKHVDEMTGIPAKINTYIRQAEKGITSIVPTFVDFSLNS